MNQPQTVTATIRIAATPTEVFPYLTEPDLLIEWIGTSAELEPEPGGVFALDMGDTRVRGTYQVVEPPDRVVFTWGIPGNDTLPAASSTVEIVLKPHGKDTVVELTHSGLPAAWRAQHQAGWIPRLAALADAARPAAA